MAVKAPPGTRHVAPSAPRGTDYHFHLNSSAPSKGATNSYSSVNANISLGDNNDLEISDHQLSANYVGPEFTEPTFYVFEPGSVENESGNGVPLVDSDFGDDESDPPLMDYARPPTARRNTQPPAVPQNARGNPENSNQTTISVNNLQRLQKRIHPRANRRLTAIGNTRALASGHNTVKETPQSEGAAATANIFDTENAALTGSASAIDLASDAEPSEHLYDTVCSLSSSATEFTEADATSMSATPEPVVALAVHLYDYDSKEEHYAIRLGCNLSCYYSDRPARSLLPAAERCSFCGETLGLLFCCTCNGFHNTRLCACPEIDLKNFHVPLHFPIDRFPLEDSINTPPYCGHTWYVYPSHDMYSPYDNFSHFINGVLSNYRQPFSAQRQPLPASSSDEQSDRSSLQDREAFTALSWPLPVLSLEDQSDRCSLQDREAFTALSRALPVSSLEDQSDRSSLQGREAFTAQIQPLPASSSEDQSDRSSLHDRDEPDSSLSSAATAPPSDDHSNGIKSDSSDECNSNSTYLNSKHSHDNSSSSYSSYRSHEFLGRPRDDVRSRTFSDNRLLSFSEHSASMDITNNVTSELLNSNDDDLEFSNYESHSYSNESTDGNSDGSTSSSWSYIGPVDPYHTSTDPLFLGLDSSYTIDSYSIDSDDHHDDASHQSDVPHKGDVVSHQCDVALMGDDVSHQDDVFSHHGDIFSHQGEVVSYPGDVISHQGEASHQGGTVTEQDDNVEVEVEPDRQ